MYGRMQELWVKEEEDDDDDERIQIAPGLCCGAGQCSGADACGVTNKD